MNQTSNYQLNQWDAEDRIMREDFNADNAKIDAALAEMAETVAKTGNCKIVYGSYTGNDMYGAYGGQKTLTFNGTPLAIFVGGNYQFFAVKGIGRAMAFQPSQQSTAEYLTWGENTVSWYNTESAFHQLNASGTTYHYIVLLATEA